MDTRSVRFEFAGLCLVAVLGCAAWSTGPAPARIAEPSLAAQIGAADAALFEAFNHCDQPGQLEKYVGNFDADIEFYHDSGGLQRGRDAQLTLTRNNVCGKFSRELVPGTLEVFPIKDFGAISRGTHRFCRFDSGKCDGEADFLVIWRRDPAGWRVSRVGSYAHRAIPPR
jgi:hypothetical protein